MSLEFLIPGVPVAKGRPKFARMGNFTKVYTPKKTLNYETFIKELFCFKFPAFKLLEGALKLRIKAFFPIPKSTSKKKTVLMLTGAIRHTKKPDADNVSKTIKDALNKICYNDDSQVATLIIQKFYSDQPRVEVEIKRINEN